MAGMWGNMMGSNSPGKKKKKKKQDSGSSIYSQQRDQYHPVSLEREKRSFHEHHESFGSPRNDDFAGGDPNENWGGEEAWGGGDEWENAGYQQNSGYVNQGYVGNDFDAGDPNHDFDAGDPHGQDDDYDSAESAETLDPNSIKNIINRHSVLDRKPSNPKAGLGRAVRKTSRSKISDDPSGSHPSSSAQGSRPVSSRRSSAQGAHQGSRRGSSRPPSDAGSSRSLGHNASRRLLGGPVRTASARARLANDFAGGDPNAGAPT